MGIGKTSIHVPVRVLDCETGTGGLSTGSVEIGKIETGTGKVEIARFGDGSIESGTAGVYIAELAPKSRAQISTGLGSITIGKAIGTMDGVDLKLESGTGSITVGIPRSTAARLNCESALGRVSNELDSTGAPDYDVPKVEISASTGTGKISVVRAQG